MRTDRFWPGATDRARLALLLTAAGWAAGVCAAPIPPVEKLLPDDTLVVLTAPDFVKLRDLFHQAPMSQLWRDLEMKPFRDKFVAKWTEEFAKPLERDLDVRFDDYKDLPQGQLTFAVTQSGWEGKPGQSPAFLLLLDARDKSEQLKKNLADLRKKWVDAGKPLRAEKVREVEFVILTLTSNDVPKTLRPLMPKRPSAAPVPEGAPKPPESRTELAIGQFESLLIVGSSIKGVEKTVARLTGGSAPALGDVAAFEADRLTHFRDAPFFAWANTRAFVDILGKLTSEKATPQPGQPPRLDPNLLLQATGLSGLKTLAFSFRDTGDGALLQFTLGAAASARAGVLKVLAAEAKDAAPPAFVPADAVKFQRMRLDGQKAWATIEKVANDISPQWVSVLNMFLQTADKAGKERDPSFDVKKDLIGNLGDDLISWQKAPRGGVLAQLNDAPSIVLVGAASAEKLAVSLRNMFAAMGASSDLAKEREFLGRKVYTAPLPTFAPPEDPKAPPPAIHYAASGGYLAFSKDVSLLEEYLRSGENPPKPLRETAGLAEAIQKAGGAGNGWVNFENEAESMRATFETFKKDAEAVTNAPLGGALGGTVGFVAEGKGLLTWFDFALLPPFEKVAKYFHFTVTSGAAGPDGITFRIFSPTPPQLRK